MIFRRNAVNINQIWHIPSFVLVYIIPTGKYACGMFQMNNAHIYRKKSPRVKYMEDDVEDEVNKSAAEI